MQRRLKHVNEFLCAFVVCSRPPISGFGAASLWRGQNQRTSKCEVLWVACCWVTSDTNLNVISICARCVYCRTMLRREGTSSTHDGIECAMAICNLPEQRNWYRFASHYELLFYAFFSCHNHWHDCGEASRIHHRSSLSVIFPFSTPAMLTMRGSSIHFSMICCWGIFLWRRVML